MDGIVLWELVVACCTCGDRNNVEEMHIVPDKGKVVCKRCSLREETQVIAMAEIDDGTVDYDW